MGVLPELGAAVDEMEWTLPTDIQAESIPAILGGGDVLMAAETGSGKTGAFCLPALQIVWETEKDIQTGKLSAKAGGVAGPKKWVLNMYDRGDAMAIAPEGLLCQSRDPQKWHGTRATNGVVGKGCYYFEATVSDDGLCRVGWATKQASLELGTCKYGFGFGGTGKKSTNKQFDDYGESFTRQDVMGCYLDLGRAEIKYSKNDKMFPVAFRIPDELRNEAFYPAVVLKNAEMLFNFGATEFKHPPKDEKYIAVCEAPADCVVANQSTNSGSCVSAMKPKANAPMCIIIEPSRELAEQTHKQIDKFTKHLDSPSVRNVLVVGGVPAHEQLRAINAGVDIVTGTPGRLEEFVESGQICLSQVRFFILDECDGLLSAGYLNLINKFHSRIPKVTPDGRRLQMIVCSATLHNFDNSLMHFPQWVDLKGADSVPDTVHHVVVPVDPKHDKRWIRLSNHVMTDGIHANDDIRPGSDQPETLSEGTKVLKGEYTLQAIKEHKMDQCLIFCRTKVDCDNLERYLKMQLKDQQCCVCLHGDRRPDERKRNLQLFKDRKVKFLICTDVAARGIDVKGMPFVINVTLPDDKANYLHRIGRVGRADRMGLAISLVSTVKEKVWYHGCPSRGKSCNNTRLTTQKGCAIWYDEQQVITHSLIQLLGDIEDHIGSTIQQVEPDIKVPADQFDGKVTYGAKRMNQGSGYKGHASLLSDAVAELRAMESQAQTSYLAIKHKQFV